MLAGLLSELTATVPVDDEQSSNARPKIGRVPSLRHVRQEEIHFVPYFSEKMNEIMAFPLDRARVVSGLVPVPSLYLGSLISTKDFDGLMAHDCKFVLTVLDSEEAPYCDCDHSAEGERARFTAAGRAGRRCMKLWDGVTYKRLTAKDDADEDIARHFEEAHDFITQALDTPSSVLVHCRAGISRSASIVISYLMKRKEW